MSTETQSPTILELKSLNRVYQIPVVADSIHTIHASLLSNIFTRSPYNASLSISEKAYSLSQPLQARLAPVLIRADSFANQGLDAVQSRYPYPFTTPTENIYRDLKSTGDQAVGAANKAAQDIARDLDKRLTPLVDRYESVISHFSPPSSPVASSSSSSFSSSASETSEGTTAVSTGQSQMERAYKLTLDLRNQLYTLSSEQLKQIQTPGTVVQRITEVVYDLNSQIANFYVSAKGKGVDLANQTQTAVHQFGQNIITQLEKIQSTTASLPTHVQESLKPVQEHLQATITALSSIIKSDAPMSDKATKIKEAVQKEVQPLVETTLDNVHSYVDSTRKYIGLKVEKAEDASTTTVTTNGDGR